jgi:hypothetical protein
MEEQQQSHSAPPLNESAARAELPAHHRSGADAGLGKVTGAGAGAGDGAAPKPPPKQRKSQKRDSGGSGSDNDAASESKVGTAMLLNIHDAHRPRMPMARPARDKGPP